MGCPAKKVCRRMAGSALLADEPLVASILDAVVGAVDVPVTLKIRTGPSAARRNAVNIAQLAESAGIAALAIHGRTRDQRYQGQAEHDTLAAVREVIDIPLIGNGDITTPEQARALIDRSGCDAVMIGRGAQGRPWIFGEIQHFLDTGEAIGCSATLPHCMPFTANIKACVSRASTSAGIYSLCRAASAGAKP
jgi:tRNA-dihydrouridine synthase B